MTPSAEPSARERIITSALALYAEHGPDAVSMRDIASHAGVSPALIPHHFGTGEGLKAAVDEHVMAIFDGLVEAMTSDEVAGVTASGFVDALLGGLPAGSPIPAYLRRLLLSASPAAKALFVRWHAISMELLAEMTARGMATESRDPAARAAFLLVNDLAMILLHDHIGAALGADPLTPEGSHRWAAEAVEAYSTGILRKEDE